MRAKRSLGQNFLINERLANSMVSLLDIKHRGKGKIVLEVGPGKGILTRALLKEGARVVAFEKDAALTKALTEEFLSDVRSGMLTLINDDIFKIPLYKNHTVGKLLSGPYVILANIPYNITGAFIKFMFSLSPQPLSAILMLQREVGERIARDPKGSILSISVRVYGTPQYLKSVSRGNFVPKPRVDSAVISIDGISRRFFHSINEKKFFDLVRKGFAHKRKKLSRNLGVEETLLSSCGLSALARAEDLSPGAWACVYKKINEQ